MLVTHWYLVLGALFILMALTGFTMRRLPMSPAMLYLAGGMLLGPLAAGMLELDPIDDAALLLRATEIAVLISLFTSGLKLRVPLSDKRWRIVFRLAVVAMISTVVMVAALGVVLLHLSLPIAVLLGAALAPTDPVLASDVQVENERDKETLRFGLTGEAGLNDGSALPFLMLGVGLLGLRPLGAWGWRWVVIDVLWSSTAALAIGALLGTAVARLVLHLRERHHAAIGLDEFLGLGLICLTYGVASLANAYGFIAVFTAAIAMRRIERINSPADAPPDVVEGAHVEEEQSTAPETAPAYMAQAVLGFNERFERIAEVAVVLIVGVMLPSVVWPENGVVFLILLLAVVRPAAVLISTSGAGLSRTQRGLMGWFGMRGIGTLNYVSYAFTLGVAGDEGRTLANLALLAIAASVILHGISVTPLMQFYRKVRKHSGAREQACASANERSSDSRVRGSDARS